MQLPSSINKFLCKPEDLTLLFSPKNKKIKKQETTHSSVFLQNLSNFRLQGNFFWALENMHFYQRSICIRWVYFNCFLDQFPWEENFSMLFVLCLNKMCIQLRFIVYIKQAIWFIILYFFSETENWRLYCFWPTKLKILWGTLYWIFLD